MRVRDRNIFDLDLFVDDRLVVKRLDCLLRHSGEPWQLIEHVKIFVRTSGRGPLHCRYDTSNIMSCS